jgi:hypothetical protein
LGSSLSGWATTTSPDVYIEELLFYVTGSARTEDFTPTVTIFISGRVGTDQNSSATFNIQTTVAQQLLDV